MLSRCRSARGRDLFPPSSLWWSRSTPCRHHGDSGRRKLVRALSSARLGGHVGEGRSMIWDGNQKNRDDEFSPGLLALHGGSGNNNSVLHYGSSSRWWRGSRSFSSVRQDEEESRNNNNNNNNHTNNNMRLSVREDVRNVAIVAHVDHGKTTLVDELLRIAGSSDSDKNDNGDDGNNNNNKKLVMDSGELEMERGITITSKVTRLTYESSPQPQQPYVINVVDTPGHADFAGEVDRILGMVSGVCLIVDAAEGCLAQTKYVLSRALSLGLTPICVLNKLDRPGAFSKVENGEVESELLDLFDDLGATEDQMNYVTVYASGKAGWATLDENTARRLANSSSNSTDDDDDGDDDDGDENTSMHVLLQAILDHIPPPQVETYEEGSFSMAATNLGYDSYLGKTCTGRIYSGSIKVNDSVTLLPRQDEDNNNNNNTSKDQELTSTVSGIFVNRGVSRTPLDSAYAAAGDIVTLAGVSPRLRVGDTLTSTSNPVCVGIPTPPLAPPTLSMDFGANTSPLMGREKDSQFVTSSKIRSRLEQETEHNVTLRVESTPGGEQTRVFGRGELQLGILIEQIRREGFELTVSPPQIVTRVCPDTKKVLEPYEEVTIDVDDEYAGAIVNALTNNRRGGVLLYHHTSSSSSTTTEQSSSSNNKTRLVFEIPSRGLLGCNGEIATLSRGSAVLHHRFLEDRPQAKLSTDGGPGRGKLVCSEHGRATAHALAQLAERGTLFVRPNDEVYPGMVLGENARSNDLDVNGVRAKAVNNMRSQNKEEKVYLSPPLIRTVEEHIGTMMDDEVLEVTPQSLRLRKRELDAGKRQKMAREKRKMSSGKK